MHNLNESDVCYLDVFKDNGYITSECFVPYYLYSKKHFDKIDYQYFTTDFLIISVWGNRLKHFSELKKKRELTDDEYRDIFIQLDLAFEAWDNFLNTDNQDKYKYIERLVKDFNFEEARASLQKEKAKYLSSKKEYADSFLEKGENHELFTNIKTCDYGNYLDDPFLDENYFRKYSSFIKRIAKLQLRLNIKNNKIEYKKLISSIFQNIGNHAIEGYLKSLLFMLFSGKLATRYKHDNFIKMLPSCRVLLRGAVNQILNNESGAPIEIHLHPEELHNRTSFFTYDLSDKALLDHEMTLFNDYLGQINHRFKGEVIYDLSLLYIDDCIREAFNSLKKAGALDNTVLVITSDHGYSYDCTPLREQFVNNHHTENYHIPLIIYDGSNPQGKKVDSYHTSKDVIPTICDLCGLNKPQSMNGKSLLDSTNAPDYAISEYMGGGCPDMRERPIQFMIRNAQYLVCYNVKMNEPFENGELVEVYDLEKDPDELNDIKQSVDKDDLNYLLGFLKNRQKEIYESFQKSTAEL